MIAAAIAASSAREMVLIIPTPLGFTYWDTFKQGWYTPDLVSCALLHVFLDCHQCRSSPANLVLYRSGLGWSSVGSLR
jgi:hypothetical protein